MSRVPIYLIECIDGSIVYVGTSKSRRDELLEKLGHGDYAGDDLFLNDEEDALRRIERERGSS